MDQHTAPPKTTGSTQTEFLRQLPQAFEDLVDHWHIVRKRACPLQEIGDLRGRTERLVDQLRDKRVGRLLDRVRRLDERLHFHVRTQQPLSRIEVDTITTIMMALRQAGIEEVPAELRRRAGEQARAASDADGAPIASTPASAKPVVFLIAPTATGPSTLAENLHEHGFDVRVFEDHDSALQALPDQPPSAFIARRHPSQAVADMRDVTKVLREQIPVSVPVLWVVDRADPETRLNVLRAGGDGCIQEPVPMASLAWRLRRLLPAEARSPHRVLLVNADPEVRKTRTAMLHDNGLVVEGPGDPMQALPAALQFAPEVILVDASLPAMDGLELVHLLRQEDALQTIPIVLLGEGPDRMENRHRFRQLELDYLRHPFSESDLLERLCLRASQYRTLTAQGTGRPGSPGAFLGRSRFEEVLEHARSTPGTDGFQAVLFLEIDRYGQLSRSHDSSILGALPARIESALRPYLQSEDVPARYDDMAYAVLIHREEPDQLEALEQSLRQAAAEVPREDLRLSDVRLRLGMTPVGPDGDARASLCEAATRCRAMAKADPAAENGIEDASGFGSTAVRTPTLDAAGRRDWSRWIRDAILGKKLFLVFQPMFPVNGNDATQRYEVLLRIRDENGGVSLPSETLTMAEQLGMGALLDRWVIDTAVERLSTHRSTSPNTTFFLKVTGDTIQDDHFLGWLGETVHRRALDPGSVVVQVREADAVLQRQRTQEMVRGLREQGIAVGLEHFGLRTTSFELLKSLDMDFVKLDRALIQGLADGSNNAPAILQLLQQTREGGVTVIAPYVENADSLARLWNERIDLLQGHFLHGPDLDLAYDPVL